MTAPRQVLAGSVYLVTRRCAQRRFLLRPSEATNDVFRYLLAVAARRYGIRLHGWCVMSNHTHIVLSDPYARLPEFGQFLNGFAARALNAALGRWESFWAPGSFSAVKLEAQEDIVDKVAYTLANPVLSGLVRTFRLWPGVWSDPDRIGAGPVDVPRPRHFFAEDGTWPMTAPLEFTAPPGFASAEEFRERVLAAVAAKEKEAQARFGRNFLGVAAVLRQKPEDRPHNAEPRRALNPRVAARDKWRRIEALTRRKAFLVAYRDAWAARRAGETGVVFPAGTYLLRVLHNVPCAVSD